MDTKSYASLIPGYVPLIFATILSPDHDVPT